MRIVISVPRIIAWVKRQPAGKVIGIPGNAHDCLVARYVEDAFGVYANVQPYARAGEKGRVSLWSMGASPTILRENTPLSDDVTALAHWFDDIHNGSTGRDVTAQKLLEAWEARAA